MDIQITARRFDIRPELKSFIEEQLKQTEKFSLEDVHSVEVMLSYSRSKNCVKRVKIQFFTYKKSNPIVITRCSDRFEKAFTEAMGALKQKLKKNKGKALDNKRILRKISPAYC